MSEPRRSRRDRRSTERQEASRGQVNLRITNSVAVSAPWSERLAREEVRLPVRLASVRRLATSLTMCCAACASRGGEDSTPGGAAARAGEAAALMCVVHVQSMLIADDSLRMCRRREIASGRRTLAKLARGSLQRLSLTLALTLHCDFSLNVSSPGDHPPLCLMFCSIVITHLLSPITKCFTANLTLALRSNPKPMYICTHPYICMYPERTFA